MCDSFTNLTGTKPILSGFHTSHYSTLESIRCMFMFILVLIASRGHRCFELTIPSAYFLS